MQPVGLLAIVALGMVFAYVLPQRIRERADYAMVRVEDRYSADMRVIRSSAERAVATNDAARKAGSASDGVPLLVTGAARASVVALGEVPMTRPAAPLDRVATVARREAHSIRSERAKILAARAKRARRRGTIATLALLAAVGGWTVAGMGIYSVWPAVAATTALGAVTVAGRRTRSIEAARDAKLVPVAREVMTAAAATSALQRIAVSRAEGRPVAPSLAETEAIRIVTTEDLAPGAVPASIPAPGLPTEEEGWTPEAVPAPAYTLKAAARARTPRPITEEDLAASAAAAERAARGLDGKEKRRRAEAEEAAPSTAALDMILARRRRETA